MSLSWEDARAAFQRRSEAAFAQIKRSEAEMLKETFWEVEARVLEEVRKLGLELMSTRLQLDPRARRRLETVLGEVEYRRPYGVCDRCGIRYAPLDCGLGIPTTGGSVRRTHRVCHAAVTARTFETAAEILEVHDVVKMSAKHVRTLSEGEGQRVVQERQAEVDALRRRELRFEGTDVPELIVVMADGGRIQTRQRENGTAWKEDKIGGVNDARPQKNPAAASAEEYEGASARTKTYVASLASWE